jgi:hypothetical protein
MVSVAHQYSLTNGEPQQLHTRPKTPLWLKVQTCFVEAHVEMIMGWCSTISPHKLILLLSIYI